MRRALPFAVLTASFFITSAIHSQNDRFAYAITDLTKEGASWNALRKIDLQTGQYSNVLLNGTDQKAIVYDAASRKQLIQQADAKYGTILQSPFATGVAAAAYDKKHNRLYFTPMFVDQLRYIDLTQAKRLVEEKKGPYEAIDVRVEKEHFIGIPLDIESNDRSGRS